MLAAVDVYIIFVSENGVTTLLDALLCKFEGGSGVKVSPSHSFLGLCLVIDLSMD